MDKKILIITSQIEKTASWPDRERYVQTFASAVSARLQDVTVLYTTYQDLCFTVRDGQLSLIDTRNNHDMRDYQLVHFKNWMYEYEEAPLVAFYLQQHGVSYFNKEVDVAFSSGKISQMFRLAVAGVPVPDTLYAHKPLLIDYFRRDTLPEGFNYPLIMKADNGSRGDDNYLIHTAQDALAVLEDAAADDKEFVLQNFIANDGDYRFLFIGEDGQPLVFRRQAEAGSHLNNTSKGGSGTFINLADLPETYIRHARRAVQVLRREIGGADIIVDKETGEPYVLEVNGTPALATGYGTDEKIRIFAEFVAHTLEEAEEE